MNSAHAWLVAQNRIGNFSRLNLLLGLLGAALLAFLVSVSWEFVLADVFFATSAIEVDQPSLEHKWQSTLKITTISVVSFAIICFALIRFISNQSADAARLSNAEMRYASIVKAEPQCVKLMDRNGKLLDMNPAGLSIIAAKNFEEVRGFDVEELVVPADRPAFHKLLLDVFEGKSGELEFKIRSLDGDVKWMWTHAVPLFDANGDVSTYMAVTYDVTERKRIDEELIAAKNASEEANKQMSIFLANVSHEFRTPLNAINGFVQMMRMEVFGPVGSEKNVEYLGEIENAAKQLSVVVNDLLDTSSLAAGVVDLTITEVDLVEQLKSVSLMLAQKAAAKNLQVTEILKFRCCKVRADEVRIRQIITNLLDNAIKFTLEGGSITCSIAARDDGAIELCISDTGIGIDQKHLPNVIKPFTRAGDAVTRSNEGSGLGLALVSEFSRLHGATFEIESDLGVGTRARVIFPCDHVVDSTTEFRNPN